jgi:hypothetical protein
MFISHKYDENKNKAINIAQSILDGNLDIINGSRQLLSLLDDLNIDRTACDGYMTIVGVDDQTDHLPVGKDRKHYAPKYLKELDEEIACCIKDFEQSTKKACRDIINFLNKL